MEFNCETMDAPPSDSDEDKKSSSSSSGGEDSLIDDGKYEELSLLRLGIQPFTIQPQLSP
jgi:hypothetical protein